MRERERESERDRQSEIVSERERESQIVSERVTLTSEIEIERENILIVMALSLKES